MTGLLQVVDEAEEIVLRQAEGTGGAVGDAEEFDGIVVQPSFNGSVAGGADSMQPSKRSNFSEALE